MGWPGVCIVALKDLGAAKPFLYDLVEAKTGTWAEPARQNPTIPLKEISGGSTNKKKRSVVVGDYYPKKVPNSEFADTDYATNSNRAAIKVLNLVIADDQVNDPAVDEIDSAPAPSISTVEYINTPRTELGDQVTYELTAVDDASTKYVQFEYRLLPDGDFNPAQYKLTNESTIQETGTGDSYEVRATAYNFSNKSGGSTTLQITFPLIERDSSTSDGGQDDVQNDIALPNIRGLEVVNRIDDDNFDKFKSPNCEFRWLKMSNTLPGNITQLNGAVDQHLEGYKIRVTDENGVVLREELVKDSVYTYTYDQNKKDTNGSPVRIFTFEVQAVATTGYVSEYVGFQVENPEPAAPANVTTLAGFTSILFGFDLPTDTDFVGVDFYILEGASGDVYADGDGTRISGNTYNPDGLSAGTEYQVGAVSADQFGTGGQIVQFGVSTALINSDSIGDLTGPITLDESGGRIITNNNGYLAIMGVTDLPDVVNPIVFAAYDSILEDTVFYVDVNGEMKLNLLNAEAALAVGSTVFGESGFQVENNNGDPRLYIGTGEDQQGVTYENSTLTVGREVDIKGVQSVNFSNFLFQSYSPTSIYDFLANEALAGSMSLVNRNLAFLTTSAETYGSCSYVPQGTHTVDKYSPANAIAIFSAVFLPQEADTSTWGGGELYVGLGGTNINETATTSSVYFGAWFKFVYKSVGTGTGGLPAFDVYAVVQKQSQVWVSTLIEEVFMEISHDYRVEVLDGEINYYKGSTLQHTETTDLPSSTRDWQPQIAADGVDLDASTLSSADYILVTSLEVYFEII
jgi:hypothetical protein